MNPILGNILQLPIADRLELIEQIWDSIDTSTEPFPLSDRQKAELDRRIELHDRIPQGISRFQLQIETAFELHDTRSTSLGSEF